MGKANQGQVRPIRQVLFSKPTLLDRAEAQMRGLGPKLEIPAGEDQIHEYQMQLTAYERFEKTAAHGEVKVEWVQKRPDDHWGSTFRMALVCGGPRCPFPTKSCLERSLSIHSGAIAWERLQSNASPVG